MLNLRSTLNWTVRIVWIAVVIGTVGYAAFKPRPKPLGCGRLAPDFTLEDIHGLPVRLSSFRGHVVVLDFWSTWCPACREMMPDFTATADAYAGQGVEFIGVNTWDERDAFRMWVPKHTSSNVTFVFDPNAEGADVANLHYQVTGIPTAFVIDKRGMIAGWIVCATQSDLSRAISATLAKP